MTSSDRVNTKLAILESMVEHLHDYLDDDRLFKTITAYPPGGERLVKLTIGAMLDLMDELRHHGLTAPQEEKLTELEQHAGRVRQQHPSPYYEKVARELKSYTDSWRWFLQSCEDGDRRCVREYPSEVSTRLRIERLLDEAGDRQEVAAGRRRVEKLDRRLRTIWSPGEFLLDDAPADEYPRDKYWWLYGRPRVDDS